MKTIRVERSLLSPEDFRLLAGSRLIERMVANKLTIRSEHAMVMQDGMKVRREMVAWCLNQCSKAVHVEALNNDGAPFTRLYFSIYFASKTEAAAFRVWWDQFVCEA